MAASDDFCLRWNDHHDLFFNAAEQLCRGDFLTDVTLSCGDKFFSAHKLVLSVSSGYFAKLFASRRAPPFTQTIVYLKDVDPKHLELILSYMYRGEINVKENELMELLNTAKGLQVKGLCDTDETELPALRPPPRAADGKRKALVVHSKDDGAAAKKAKVGDRWSGAQQDQVPAAAGAAVIAQADPDYQGQQAYDEDYYVAPASGEQAGEFDDVNEQDMDSGLPMAMPVETTLAEESEENDEVAEEENDNSNSNEQLLEQKSMQISPMMPKTEYSPPPPPLPPPPPPPVPTPITPTQQKDKQEPMFNCPFCAKPFHARWMLERHLPSHTGQRPYKCMRCERRFSLQSSAVRHVKNVHKNEDFDAESEASSMVVKDKGGIIGGDGGIGGSGDTGFGAADNLGLAPPLPPIEEVMRVGDQEDDSGESRFVIG